MVAAILIAETSAFQWIPVAGAGGVGAIAVFVLMRFLNRIDA